MAKPKKPAKTDSKKPSMRDLAGGKDSGKKRSLKSRSKAIKNPFKKTRATTWLFSKIGWIVPKYFRGAWSEIRQTTWPGRRETVRLTVAVFIFSVIFAALVAVLDFALDKIFKNLIT